MRALARLSRRMAGPRRRRRMSAALCVAVVGALGAYFIASALAVGTTTIQQNYAMELDGNATSGNGSAASPAEPNSHDWDNVFAQFNCLNAQPATCTGNSIDGASVRSFNPDPFNSGSTDNIYTGGSTKDGLPLSGWLWKTGAPQGKDDLEDALAAEYASAPVCDTAGGTPAPNTSADCVNHQLLFFSADRYSDKGDSDIGFWFFKSDVHPGPTGSFIGHHTDGDLLVLSTFQNGGVVPQVSVYQWSCPGATTGAQCDSTGSLSVVGTAASADCINGVDTHGNAVPATTGNFCATVNPANGVPSPWPYTEKPSDGSFVTPNQFGGGTFFEGGLDLTNLGFGNACFTSFLAETRSAQSTTATLSDFVPGSFQECSAHMTTNPALTAGGAAITGKVLPGTPVTDTATVTGTGVSTPPTPTGTVTFTICGPNATPTSTTNCSSAGSGTLSATGQPAGSATAQSSPQAPTMPGQYCFHASWPGDSNYTQALTETNSANECFSVAPLPTTTATKPGNGSGAFTSTNTPVLGASAFDTALVTAYTDSTLTTPTGVGGYPAGNVTFYVCSPATLMSNSASTCSSSIGTQVGSPIATTAVSGATPPNSQGTATSSPGVPLNAAGEWCFAAYFVPTSTAFVSTGSQDATSGECFNVPPQPTTTGTTPVDGSGKALGSTVTLTGTGGITLYDSAKITGVAGAGNPTGTVAFAICGPVSTGTCDASSTSSPGYSAFDPSEPVGGFGTNAGGNPFGTATSTGTVVTTVGTYCFYAKYSSNTANYLGSDDPNDATECVTVKDTSTTASAQDWLPNDTATFGTAGGNDLNGTVTFTLWPDANCNNNGTGTDTALYTEPASMSPPITLTNAVPGTKVSTNNTSVKVKATETVSWLVTFTSSDPNVANSSHCEVTSLTITN